MKVLDQFVKVRRTTEMLVEPLELEDFTIQSMPDVSPPKWHLAHTTWFFEKFILSDIPSYQPFDPEFDFLFNSYYEGVGSFHARPKRGLLSRPSIATIRRYRQHVDNHIIDTFQRGSLDPSVIETLQVGIHHEQQHQELLLTDIKHNLWCLPQKPAYLDTSPPPSSILPSLSWLEINDGVYEIGATSDQFSYDNERPRHRCYVERASLGSRLVSNGEFIEFVNDGGYQQPLVWLSDGWDWVRSQGIKCPLYWAHHQDDGWQQFTLHGMQPLSLNEPVCHVSYFEADAFARWSQRRLPYEQEWEVFSQQKPIKGNFIESERLHPCYENSSDYQLYGDCWEWTSSSYQPYPGFKTADGALQEYNGKFMVNQYVLRGGSCVSSHDHLRASYRNFFPPTARWQFSGIRVASHT